MRNWFDSTIVETGRLPLFVLFVAFLVAFLFIRLSVRMIRAEARWWPGNVISGGVHVHHVVFGLVSMLISGMGMVTLASSQTPVADMVLAGFFGVGAALVLDEFALVLYLDDVYWQERGRASVDAIFVAVAVLGLFVIGFRPLGFDGSFDELFSEQDGATIAVTAVLLVGFAALAIITLLKGKLWTGLLGLFVVPLLIFGASRLARPGSPWARWFYGPRLAKQERAVRREQQFRQPAIRAKIAVQEAISGRPGATAQAPRPRAAWPQERTTARLANAVRWRQTRRRLRAQPMWRLPATLVTLAAVAAVLLINLDGTELDGEIPAGMDAGSAATLLSVIAGGMITLAGLVFTALTLAMQFGASQLSIRVVPMLQQTPIMRWSIGMFLATFTFALIIAFDLVTASEAVPMLSTTLALVLAFISTLVLIRLVAQVANVLNPGKLLGQIADSGRVAAYRISREGAHGQMVAPAVEGPTRVVKLGHASPDGRVLLAVNRQRIVRLARAWDVGIVVEPAIGDFVSVGAPLFTVTGRQSLVRDSALLRALVFGETHSPDVSPAAAVQAIVDVALKALSPAVNDPSRAVQAIDHLEDLLMLLANQIPAEAERESTGNTGNGIALTWESYVAIAVDEIRNFAPDSLMVQRRLRALLTNLIRECSDERRGPVEQRLAALDEMTARRWQSPLDALLSRTPDPQGFGRAADSHR